DNLVGQQELLASIRRDYRTRTTQYAKSVSFVLCFSWFSRGGQDCPSYVTSLRQLAVDQFALPLVHQRPVDRAGAEVGHVEIGLAPRDCAVDQPVILAKHRAVAGQEPLDVAGLDPLQRLDEIGDVAAVMGVDRANATIAEQIVAGKEQVAHPERELAV